MLPECVEDYVGGDNPVRFLDAFVEQLELEKLGFKTAADTGRPGYEACDLLKLYLYGYLNRVRSSRELERLTQRNLEVIWLLRRLRPDHKTISEFRRAHRSAFRGVFRQFNVMCRELKLFGAELVAIDGSVFKAVNAKARNFTVTKLAGLLQSVDRGIERYLAALDRSDASGAAGAAGSGADRDLPRKLAALRQSKARYEQMLGQLAEQGERQISLTDADARLMSKSTSKDSTVGYNVQSAVDSKHHLIVHVEATTQANDVGQLNSMAQAAKSQLEAGTLTVVADTGYWSSADLAAAAAGGITAHVPRPQDAMQKQGFYGQENFRHDEQADVCHCPQGQVLTRHSDSTGWEGQRYAVYYNTAACQACAWRSACTSGRYRKIKLGPAHQAARAVEDRLRTQPDVFARRKELVEHPFGTIKFWWGQGTFLTRGRAAVNAEVALSALAYNMRRVLNLLGVGALLQWLALPS
jgi:transposase